MKLEQPRSIYFERSKQVSDIVRQLGFAGIAVIWLFNAGEASQIDIPPELVFPGLLIVLSLGFDLSQYVLATVLWGVFQRNKELSGIPADEEITAPRWINWPALVCFTLKTVAILIAYGALATFLLNMLTARGSGSPA
jgi:hypothetical protein